MATAKQQQRVTLLDLESLEPRDVRTPHYVRQLGAAVRRFIVRGRALCRRGNQRGLSQLLKEFRQLGGDRSKLMPLLRNAYKVEEAVVEIIGLHLERSPNTIRRYLRRVATTSSAKTFDRRVTKKYRGSYAPEQAQDPEWWAIQDALRERVLEYAHWKKRVVRRWAQEISKSDALRLDFPRYIMSSGILMVDKSAGKLPLQERLAIRHKQQRWLTARVLPPNFTPPRCAGPKVRMTIISVKKVSKAEALTSTAPLLVSV